MIMAYPSQNLIQQVFIIGNLGKFYHIFINIGTDPTEEFFGAVNFCMLSTFSILPDYH